MSEISTENYISFDDVKEIYRSDPYRLKLAIQHHIWELYQRQCKRLSVGKDGLDDESYQKELMDLFILLEMWKEFSRKKALYFERRNRFVFHIAKTLDKPANYEEVPLIGNQK